MKQPFLKQPTPITQVCTNSSDSTPSQLHEERSSLFFTLLPTAHLNSMVFDFYSLFFSLTDLAVLEWELVFHARKACALPLARHSTLLLALALEGLCANSLIWGFYFAYVLVYVSLCCSCTHGAIRRQFEESGPPACESVLAARVCT